MHPQDPQVSGWFQAGRRRPIFFMRVTKVVGLTPRSSAAPSAPLIFQFVFSRMTSRFSRSRRCNSDSVRNSGSASPVARAAGRVVAGADSSAGKSKSSTPPRVRPAAEVRALDVVARRARARRPGEADRAARSSRGGQTCRSRWRGQRGGADLGGVGGAAVVGGNNDVIIRRAPDQAGVAEVGECDGWDQCDVGAAAVGGALYDVVCRTQSRRPGEVNLIRRNRRGDDVLGRGRLVGRMFPRAICSTRPDCPRRHFARTSSNGAGYAV